MADRVDTTATVWLGLTMGCARCHDHKYDPITQHEFYQLFAFFNNIPERGKANKFGNSPPMIPAPTPAHRAELAALERKLEAAAREAARLEPEIAAAQAVWEKRLERSGGSLVADARTRLRRSARLIGAACNSPRRGRGVRSRRIGSAAVRREGLPRCSRQTSRSSASTTS